MAKCQEKPSLLSRPCREEPGAYSQSLSTCLQMPSFSQQASLQFPPEIIQSDPLCLRERGRWDLLPIGTKHIPIFQAKDKCQEGEEGAYKIRADLLFPRKANSNTPPEMLMSPWTLKILLLTSVTQLLKIIASPRLFRHFFPKHPP